MRRPVPVATLSALLLIVLGLPFFGIKFNTVDATVLPKSASARQAYEAVKRRLPALPRHADLGRPRRRDAGAGEARWRPGCAGSTGVAEVLPPQRLDGEVTAIQAISSHPFASEASQSTVHAIRDLATPPGTTRPGRRRHAPTSSTSRAASPATCRSRWRSSSSPPW